MLKDFKRMFADLRKTFDDVEKNFEEAFEGFDDEEAMKDTPPNTEKIVEETETRPDGTVIRRTTKTRTFSSTHVKKGQS